MTLLPLTAMIAMQAADPLSMDFAHVGTFNAGPGLWQMPVGRLTTPDEIAKACDGKRFLLLGESHDSTGQKREFAKIIEALLARGRNVSVGMEMFTRPNQPNLAPWSMGYWTENEFIEKANWKTEWGFDFSIYRPVFEVVKENHLPLIALNVPRDWVRAVGQGGPSALPQNAGFTIDPTNKEHQAMFLAMIGGAHPGMSETAMDNMHAAQVVWDTGMADTAVQWYEKRRDQKNSIIVMIAGSGHAMYGLGINAQVTKRTGLPVPCLIGVDTDGEAVKVSRDIGQWVYAVPKA